MTNNTDASLNRLTRIDEIAASFEASWRTGRRVSIESVLRGDPDVPQEDLLLELLQVELELRLKQGDQIDRAEYSSRFPQYAATVQGAFAKAGIAEQAAPTLVSWVGDTPHDDNGYHLLPEIQGALNSEDAEAVTIALERSGPPGLNTAPRIVGPYEIIESIGEGGMGIVYKARHIRQDRIVALKLIRPGQLARIEAKKRFKAEATAAKTLNHPNIVPVFDFYVGDEKKEKTEEEKQVHYIAMPFVSGKTLEARIRTGTMLPHDAARLTLKLAKAIVHAHAHNVLHRDIKPANILFGESDEPLLTDFGLAQDLLNDDRLTHTGQVIGTLGFMPPEQAGQKNATSDIRSDVYGLGALLYSVIKGRPPFVGPTQNDVINKVLYEEPVSPRADDKSIPRDLETICLNCLSKSKHERYATAQALADDLQLFLDGKPIKARPLPMIQRAWRWCRRKPLLATVIGLSLLIAVGATTTAGVMTQLRKQERDARLVTEIALLDAKDATLFATEQQIRAQLQSSDATELGASIDSDDSNMAWNASSVDSALVKYRKTFSFPKVSSFCAGDWGYFDFRPSPEGDELATCDHAGVVQILNAENGRELHRLADGVKHPIWHDSVHWSMFVGKHKDIAELPQPTISFSIDWIDDHIVVAVNDKNQLIRIKVATSEHTELKTFDAAAHLIRVRRENGTMLACLENGQLQLLRLDGQRIAANEQFASRPMQCEFSPEMQCWIVGYADGQIVVFDDQLKIRTTIGLPTAIQDFSVSREADAVFVDVAAQHDALVRYRWNADDSTLQETAKFEIPGRMHDHYLIAVQAVPDQNRLYARDNKGKMVAWDLKEQQFIGSFTLTQIFNPQIDKLKSQLRWPAVLDRNPAYLDIAANGQLRAVDQMGVVMYFDLKGPQKSPAWSTLAVTVGKNPDVATSPRSPDRFWALDDSGTLSRINATLDKIDSSLPNAHPGPVPSLVAMKNGDLATVSGDRTIRIWRTGNEVPQEVRRIEHVRNLISLAVHEDTRRIAAMDDNSFLSLWNLDTGRQIVSVDMETVAYPDDPEKTLAQRNEEAANRGVAVLSRRPYTGKIAFNLEGQYLAAFGVVQQFDVLDCDNGMQSVKLGGNDHESKAAGGTALCWSGTARYRLIAGDEYGGGPTWLLDKEAATHVGRIGGSVTRGGYPTDFEQTPDGRRVCCLMRDGRLLFVTSEHFVPTIMEDTGVRNAKCLAIGGTGESILVAGRDGSLRFGAFADFSLPDESTVTPLNGIRHTLVAPEDDAFPAPSSLSLPTLSSTGQGALTLIMASGPKQWDGELRLIRRRENAWQLDRVDIPNSPGTDSSRVFVESPGMVFSKANRPIIALRQIVPGEAYNGRVLLTWEQADGSWNTEVVLKQGNAGHTCVPIQDPNGEVNSLLHFDWEEMLFRYSKRAPETKSGWPTGVVRRGRGFRTTWQQDAEGTLHAATRTIRGAGDYAPDLYFTMKPGESPQWEPAPGIILRLLSDGTPVVQQHSIREATCGNIYRRVEGEWKLWTRIPGEHTLTQLNSAIHVAADDALWVADFRQSAGRLYAWRFKDEAWKCFEIQNDLPKLVTTVACWIEENNRLVIVLCGQSPAESGSLDVIDVPFDKQFSIID